MKSIHVFSAFALIAAFSASAFAQEKKISPTVFPKTGASAPAQEESAPAPVVDPAQIPAELKAVAGKVAAAWAFFCQANPKDLSCDNLKKFQDALKADVVVLDPNSELSAADFAGKIVVGAGKWASTDGNAVERVKLALRIYSRFAGVDVVSSGPNDPNAVKTADYVVNALQSNFIDLNALVQKPAMQSKGASSRSGSVHTFVGKDVSVSRENRPYRICAGNETSAQAFCQDMSPNHDGTLISLGTADDVELSDTCVELDPLSGSIQVTHIGGQNTVYGKITCAF